MAQLVSRLSKVGRAEKIHGTSVPYLAYDRGGQFALLATLFLIPLSPGFEIEDARESLKCDVFWRWRVYFFTSVRGKKDGLQGGRNTATKISCRLLIMQLSMMKD
jgi:hypothetical protein